LKNNDKLEIELESSLEYIKNDLLLNWQKQLDTQDILEHCSARVKKVEQLLQH
jgi:hypothetical protein